MEMIEDLVKIAIKKINSFNEDRYYIREGNEEEPPIIYKKIKGGGKEIVCEDILTITTITVTSNTIMLYDEGSITIISPSNYTYHGLL